MKTLDENKATCIKNIIARGKNERNEQVSVIEFMDKDEMTSVGTYLVVDGEWFDMKGSTETAIAEFNMMCK